MRTTIKKISTMLLAFVIVVTSMSTIGMENTYAASKSAAKPGKIYGVTLSQKAISGSSQKNITVKWNKLSKNVKGYRIYRKTDSGSWKYVKYAGAKKYTKSSKTQSATFRVNAGHKYTFRIRGYNYKVYKKKVYRSYGAYSSTRATTVKKPVTNTNPSNPSDSDSSSGGSGGATVSIKKTNVVCDKYTSTEKDVNNRPIIYARADESFTVSLDKSVSGTKKWYIDLAFDADRNFIECNAGESNSKNNISICSINQSTGYITLKKPGEFIVYCSANGKYSKSLKIIIFPSVLNLQYKDSPVKEGTSGLYIEGYPRRANSGWNESEWKKYVRDGDTLYIDPTVSGTNNDDIFKNPQTIPGAVSVSASTDSVLSTIDDKSDNQRYLDYQKNYRYKNGTKFAPANKGKSTLTVKFKDNRVETYTIEVKETNPNYLTDLKLKNDVKNIANQVREQGFSTQRETADCATKLTCKWIQEQPEIMKDYGGTCVVGADYITQVLGELGIPSWGMSNNDPALAGTMHVYYAANLDGKDCAVECTPNTGAAFIAGVYGERSYTYLDYLCGSVSPSN